MKKESNSSEIKFSCSNRNIIIFDLVYIIITGVILYLDPKIPLLVVVFNPVSVNLVIILRMFYYLIKFSKYIKRLYPEIWKQFGINGYPEVIHTKWIFKKGDVNIPSSLIPKKVMMKNRIILTYSLFLTNIFIFVFIVIGLSLIYG